MQVLVNHAVHPVEQLAFAAFLKHAALLRHLLERLDDFPELLESCFLDGGREVGVRGPAGRGRADEFDHALEFAARDFRLDEVVAVGLVDDDGVGELHDAFLDALQLVARARQYDEQEEVDHAAHGDFGLADADGLNQDDVVASRLAEQHGLAALARDAAECAARRRRTDERFRPAGKGPHPGLVTQYRALRDGAGRIDGEDGDTVAFVAEHVAERLDHRALASAGDARDADAKRLARARQQPLEDALRLREMARAVALDERDGARERHAVALCHALDVVVLREHHAARRLHLAGFECRVQVADRRVADALDAAHDAAGEFFVACFGAPARTRDGVAFFARQFRCLCGCCVMRRDGGFVFAFLFLVLFGQFLQQLCAFAGAHDASSFARSIRSFSNFMPASGMFVPGAKIATAPCS